MATHQNLEVLFHQLSVLEKLVDKTEKEARDAIQQATEAENRVTKAEKEARHALQQATQAEQRATEAVKRTIMVEGRAAWLEHILEAEKEARTALKQAMEAELTERILALENKIRTIWKGVTDKFKGAETVAINIDKRQKVAAESMANYNKRVNNLDRFMSGKIKKIYGRISEMEKTLDPANQPRPSAGP